MQVTGKLEMFGSCESTDESLEQALKLGRAHGIPDIVVLTMVCVHHNTLIDAINKQCKQEEGTKH